MEVILTKEAENSLKSYFYELAADEFSKAKNDLAIGRPLNQKEIAEFLQVSTTTIRLWESQGMPYGSMGAKSKYYDKLECKRWVLNQKR
ncbi:MerR family transcriptional regulator [Vagococcus salmoninarum]|uniref:MerR family transcriptional regulator n=1 Tax=Vagococcus salmoninarum TaxID=2739 RepID=UPI00187F3AAA|nr:MerR family transcriptional regulator [Vagococcus salmoninarum]MBE9390038.1 MerR family transcriptional regulator [Vagococcus salmoninarum]